MFRPSTLPIRTLPTFVAKRFEFWTIWNLTSSASEFRPSDVFSPTHAVFVEVGAYLSRFSRSRQTAIQMICWSSDLDSPRRVNMNAIFFKPFGNKIVKFMTIYVSKPTSLTPIWVEHFSDLSIQSLGLFGIQKMCRQASFLHTPVAIALVLEASKTAQKIRSWKRNSDITKACQ